MKVDVGCRLGALEVLYWNPKWNIHPWSSSNVIVGAAHGGHLEVLKWARTHGCPWDARTCANAAYGGHLKVLQWARSP